VRTRRARWGVKEKKKTRRAQKVARCRFERGRRHEDRSRGADSDLGADEESEGAMARGERKCGGEAPSRLSANPRANRHFAFFPSAGGWASCLVSSLDRPRDGACQPASRGPAMRMRVTHAVKTPQLPSPCSAEDRKSKEYLESVVQHQKQADDDAGELHDGDLVPCGGHAAEPAGGAFDLRRH
jgi:hypothetical protein